MIISSGAKKPKIDPGAYVSPAAIVSGDVTIEEGCAILHGAVVTSEGAPVTIGANSVVMENAVVKASGGKAMQFACTIGESCIIGPSAYVVGATLEPGVFIAAGARVFNGATIDSGTSVALGGIVHVKTHLRSGQHVPMQHIAYGDPAEIYAPERAHEVHAKMQFFADVFNLPDSEDVRAKAAENYSKFLKKAHAQDAAISEAKKQPVKPTSKTEEPPPTQATEVEKVVDSMFVELEEARMRREAAKERERQQKNK